VKYDTDHTKNPAIIRVEMPKKPDELFDFAALWDSGTALDAAWLRHSPTVEPFDLVALRTHPDHDDGLKRHPRYAMLGDWLPPTYELRQEKLKSTIDSLRHYLLTLLYEGNLWAIGCRTREEDSQEKVIVPPEYFFYPAEDGNAFKSIDWQQGVLNVDGARYFDIRVVVPLPIEKTVIPDSAGDAAAAHEPAAAPPEPDEPVGVDEPKLSTG
jgi:hypothetical protein